MPHVRLLFLWDGFRKFWLQTGGVPYLLIIGVLMASSLQWAAYYAGIASLFGRDQGYVLVNNGPIYPGTMDYTRLFPYLDYPFEYPFFGGFMMLAVNCIGYLVRPALESIWLVLYMSSFMMGAAASFIAMVWARARVPAYKALLLFALNPAVLDQFDITFDMVGALLLLLSVYWLARGKESSSAVALALSAGVKGFPLLALPFMAWNAKRGRWRYALTSGGTFAAGMAFQYALSPTNFFRAGSYLTSYGIEGSWLGLLVPQSIIDYQHWATFSSWIATGSTALHLFQPVQLLSLALIAAGELCIWRYRARFAPKTAAFLAMSLVVIFWWYSPPQFLYYPMALLPLLARNFKATLGLTTAFSLFGNFTLWIRIPVSFFQITSYDWVLISTGYQAALAVWILYEVRRGTILLPRRAGGPEMLKSPATVDSTMEKKISNTQLSRLQVLVAWCEAFATKVRSRIASWTEVAEARRQRALHSYSASLNWFARLQAALGLAFAVTAVIIVAILSGFGLVILYAVENTATVAGNLSTSQQASVASFFGNLIGSYGLMPLVVLVMIVGLVIASFFLFIPRGGGSGEV